MSSHNADAMCSRPSRIEGVAVVVRKGLTAQGRYLTSRKMCGVKAEELRTLASPPLAFAIFVLAVRNVPRVRRAATRIALGVRQLDYDCDSAPPLQTISNHQKSRMAGSRGHAGDSS